MRKVAFTGVTPHFAESVVAPRIGCPTGAAKHSLTKTELPKNDRY